MFYSHQLLARKAPLGQIWMAATLGSKIKRRSLEKLDIPRICEEILNPSIPMALRLSGILMGGVVNVFKRKVDVLYDDVNRFLEELHRAFRAKISSNSGSKTQARGKAQVRSEAAITIADKDYVNFDTELHSMLHSDPVFEVGRFQNMTLEDLHDQYVNIFIGDDDPSSQRHQADPADITLPDNVNLGTMHSHLFGCFERFDAGDDVFSQVEFTSQVLPETPQQVPKVDIPPLEPIHEHKQMEGENRQQEKNEHSIKKEDEHEVPRSEDKERSLQRHFKRKTRGNCNKAIIDEQMMIPYETYHSWLNDDWNVNLMRRKRKTKHAHMLHSIKLDTLMDLPPLCLMSISKNFLHEIHYPEQLMELWLKNSIGNPQTPPRSALQNGSPHSLPEQVQLPDFAEFQTDFDIDKMMAAEEDNNLVPRVFPGGFTSSGSLGEASHPISSSEAGHKPYTSERQNSLPIGNLDTVAEDMLMADLAPLEETGPTQTPSHQTAAYPFDKITESIRMQLKSHFDKPGNSQTESFNQLAEGLPRKRAAQLFYQTCVMATLDYVRVEQTVPFGDISISRGTKM
ncbi:hypothetical protein HPP92_003310 [Vanilla planifolia]|uniref:Sister chromatid cohesion 1 protein 1 n=1 Tax=Vanilla planifolia TaxID=51239 RepID=A0A835SGE3_VANPL|nr:hypothetical protein HPP92_003310 [Vanilla planifolia]